MGVLSTFPEGTHTYRDRQINTVDFGFGYAFSSLSNPLLTPQRSAKQNKLVSLELVSNNALHTWRAIVTNSMLPVAVIITNMDHSLSYAGIKYNHEHKYV